MSEGQKGLSRRLALLASLLLGLVLFVGCGSRSSLGKLTVNGCDDGQVACEGQCIDPLTSSEFCGALTGCVNAISCEGDAECVGGACHVAPPDDCQPGLSSCRQECVDTRVDALHCGGCDRRCAPSELCSMGDCVGDCNPGSILCDAECVDTLITLAHCGGCGNVCPAEHVCQQGECLDDRAELALLDIDTGLLSPGFEPNRFAYAFATSADSTHVMVVAVPVSEFASMTLNGVPVAHGAPFSVPLNRDDTLIVIEVTAASGAQQRYTVVVEHELYTPVYLKASNTGAGDAFGVTVAVDGDTVVVGAPNEDSASRGVNRDQSDNSAPNSGAVYVFRRSADSWQQEAYLKASNTGAGDAFGSSVFLKGDTLAVGADLEASSATGVNGNGADNSLAASGAVYVFRRTGTEWSQEAYVKASNTGEGDNFGLSVTLADETLLVGAPGEASSATGANGDQTNDEAPASGAVYVFQRSGTSWRQSAYLKASNTGAGDSFGNSVYAHGTIVAVGAHLESSSAIGVGGDQTDDFSPGSGAVYLFQNINGGWHQRAYLKASNTSAGDQFGWNIALEGDTLAVGAPYEDGSSVGVNGSQNDLAANSGAAYLFRSTGNVWTQVAYIKPLSTQASDSFGETLALSGQRLAVGALMEDGNGRGTGGDPNDNSVPASGAAYVFLESGGVWAQALYVKATNTGPSDFFGQRLGLFESTLIVGANAEDGGSFGVNGDGEDNSASNSGAAYVYELP